MPIISQAQKEKEKEQKQAALDLEIKRKRNAKKVAFLWGVSCAVSSLVFFLIDQNLGILLTIISSSVPAVINLVDD